MRKKIGKSERFLKYYNLNKRMSFYSRIKVELKDGVKDFISLVYAFGMDLYLISLVPVCIVLGVADFLVSKMFKEQND